MTLNKRRRLLIAIAAACGDRDDGPTGSPEVDSDAEQVGGSGDGSLVGVQAAEPTTDETVSVPIVDAQPLLAHTDELANLSISALKEPRFDDAWLCEG